jgi:hypothetical protein
MCSITKALDSIKSAGSEAIPARVIERACQAIGNRYRKRKFDPVVTPHLSKHEFNPSAVDPVPPVSRPLW